MVGLGGVHSGEKMVIICNGTVNCEKGIAENWAYNVVAYFCFFILSNFTSFYFALDCSKHEAFIFWYLCMLTQLP